MEGDRESMEEGRKCGGASVLNEVYRVFSYNQKKRTNEVVLISKGMVPTMFCYLKAIKVAIFLQGEQDPIFIFQIEISQKLGISDPMLVKPKWIHLAVEHLFEKL